MRSSITNVMVAYSSAIGYVSMAQSERGSIVQNTEFLLPCIHCASIVSFRTRLREQSPLSLEPPVNMARSKESSEMHKIASCERQTVVADWRCGSCPCFPCRASS